MESTIVRLGNMLSKTHHAAVNHFLNEVEGRNRKKKLTKKRLVPLTKRVLFTSKQWLYIYESCADRDYPRGCYNLKVVALAKAFEKAQTLEDYILLAERLPSADKRKKPVLKKILEFDLVTPSARELLRRSSSARLQSVAWYLDGTV